MPRRKYVAQVENIYFLSRVGESLRWAISDITREARRKRLCSFCGGSTGSKRAI